MAIAITIPRLGWNMDEGVFAGWLKRDGEPVRAGEPLFTLECEKATQDVEATDEGILRIPSTAPAAGDSVAVGAVIGHLLRPGESEAILDHVAPASVAPSPPPVVAEAVAPARSDGPNVGGRPRISPLARRLARELGVDWSALRGSGSTGRIRKVDILAASHAREQAAAGPAKTGDAAPAPRRSVAISSRRRAIARRLLESLRGTAPVTLTATADSTNLVNLRAQFRAVWTPDRHAPGYTDFVVKLAALSLLDHPLLHARWADDRLVIPDEPQIGVAVDTPDGLLVPVIHGATSLGLTEIAQRLRELAARARERRLRPEEMQGATFTITNLGSLGVETFTPIINVPECAVLGMGRIIRQPVMMGENVVGRERMSLSLTFDHRIVDGAPAARFLQSLIERIENPGPWLIR
jgi:pyruvate dehydrogenase E2 component (dihydrolipoamide acetyltransferase)